MPSLCVSFNLADEKFIEFTKSKYKFSKLFRLFAYCDDAEFLNFINL